MSYNCEVSNNFFSAFPTWSFLIFTSFFILGALISYITGASFGIIVNWVLDFSQSLLHSHRQRIYLHEVFIRIWLLQMWLTKPWITETLLVGNERRPCAFPSSPADSLIISTSGNQVYPCSNWIGANSEQAFRRITSSCLSNLELTLTTTGISLNITNSNLTSDSGCGR